MKKVIFTDKTGRTRAMAVRDAELLRRLRRGTYQTRDMVAAPADAAAAAHVVDPIASQGETDHAALDVDLDALDVEALRALARERGVDVHHRAGADKIRAVLREAQG